VQSLRGDTRRNPLIKEVASVEIMIVIDEQGFLPEILAAVTAAYISWLLTRKQKENPPT